MDDAPFIDFPTRDPSAEATASGATSGTDQDLDLLRQWRDGNLDAGADLLRRYKAFFHRTCSRLGVRSEETVVDLFQEVVLGITQDLPTLPERIEKSFAGWLAWRIRDVVTRGRRALRILDPLPSGDPATKADPLEDLALREVLQRCAGLLPARENRVFALRFLGGLSLKETADALASNVNAVSQSLFRLSRRMRACLETAGYRG
jgi:RNA polymerase sigma factor (sigma-70 family)